MVGLDAGSFSVRDCFEEKRSIIRDQFMLMKEECSLFFFFFFVDFLYSFCNWMLITCPIVALAAAWSSFCSKVQGQSGAERTR